LSVEQSESSIGRVVVSAYTIPTDLPEGGGTIRWDSTTLILCEIHTARQTGLGYTYGNQATPAVADHLAAKCLLQHSALDIPGLPVSRVQQVRNDGSRGIASMAISALDIALWISRRSYWVVRSSICSALCRLQWLLMEV
jgi:L-alanine-DL-glutamate epimerase-like enolase superfamily enzyme